MSPTREPAAGRHSAGEPLDPSDLGRIEGRLRNFFAREARGVTTAYLFGSVARGVARGSSDVDVAVLLAETPPRTLAGLHLGLEGELEKLLGLPVQLVVLNRASAELVHYVLRDGRLLLDRDPEKRIRFEIRARQEYFDLLPFLRRYRGQEARA